jgi:hypothetical protein
MRATMKTAYDGLMQLITGRAPDGAASEAPAAEALVVGDHRAGAAARVHVYRHMYRARIREALESQFPRLAKRLGADRFAELAFAYVSDEPSRHPSLRFIGRKLPDWLAGHARPEEAWLADLARLEWARADVFDAADETPLTIDDLRGWPQDRFAELPLQLVGAHRIVTAAHRVANRWDGDGGGDAATGEGESLLVWRQGVAVYHRVVDGDERAALALTAEGTTFGVLCDRLLDDRPAEQATAQAFAWLSTWTADELLQRRETSGGSED